MENRRGRGRGQSRPLALLQCTQATHRASRSPALPHRCHQALAPLTRCAHNEPATPAHGQRMPELLRRDAVEFGRLIRRVRHIFSRSLPCIGCAFLPPIEWVIAIPALSHEAFPLPHDVNYASEKHKFVSIRNTCLADIHANPGDGMLRAQFSHARVRPRFVLRNRDKPH
jgi:hypothetical protein